MEKRRFTYLLDQYNSRVITSEELQELRNYVRQEENTSLFTDLIAEEMEHYEDQGFDKTPYREFSKKALTIDKVFDTSGEHPVIRPINHVHFLRKWGWAAAVLILLGVSTIAIVLSSDRKSAKSEKDITKRITPPDILPGGDRAVLTLADGSIIVLDSAADGQLAMQGNTSIIKDANGKITYRLRNLSDNTVLLNTMSTPKGGQYRLALPDGSIAWLNAASSITFPAAFIGKERSVTVSGEVFFEVAGNKEKPFIVKTSSQEIVVLGTQFNVDAYQDEPQSKTSLLEGSIKINNQLLRPGQAFIGGKIEQTDVEQDIAWKKGIFNFSGMDLPAVMRQLSRWYDIEVKYEGTPPVKEFRGKMSRNLQLSQVLNLFKGLNLQFTLEGKVLTVKEQ